MNDFEKERKNQVFELITVSKFIYMIIALITLFNILSIDFSKVFADGLLSSNGVVFVGVIVFIFIYQICVLVYTKKLSVDRTPLIIDYVEMLAYLLFFTFLIHISGGYKSNDKFIYVFMILIYTIQFGMKLGINLGGICSIVILFFDFTSGKSSTELSTYFQRDLVMCGAFFLSAWLLGTYVETERNHSKRLTNLANRDELTGLYNHRHFHVILDFLMKNKEKSNEPISLLFIDIDYFKTYNDTHGHPAGDKVLKQVSTIFKKHETTKSTFFRYGGEEFTVILPETPTDKAYEFAEELRKEIEDSIFDGQEKQPNGNLTISIGISTYPDKSDTKQSLIKSADNALYTSKALSRNRVSIAE